ncbi:MULTISPECIES: hypothetical protein [Leptolyngbya]|nr:MULTISPECIES: hypothetical protein [Leptolyngbya]BAS60141.1 hypothetical protein LBWT_X2130 [Leptolyngbya boryana IAM M-101]BAS66489.1 hypothetical protein LBDG_X2130 [Leptolyngbya boryana dg5]
MQNEEQFDRFQSPAHSYSPSDKRNPLAQAKRSKRVFSGATR